MIAEITWPEVANNLIMLLFFAGFFYFVYKMFGED